MALIQCPECGRMISDRAAQCIHCGCPIVPQTAQSARPQYAAGVPSSARSQAQASRPSMPDTHVWHAVALIFLFGLPFGIVAAIKASQVEACYNEGRYADAEKASLEAKKWCKIGDVFAVCVVIVLIVALFMVI